MSDPADTLKPLEPVFDEAWQAQVLAIADSMVTAGHFTAKDWAEALGAELKKSDQAGLPDTLETYYLAALTALENLSASRVGIDANMQADRKATWTRAYLNTPHGSPVLLQAGEAD